MTNKNFIFCCAAGVLLSIAFTNTQAQWQTSGSNLYYNNGNVEIGTSNPNYTLHSVAYNNSISASSFLWGESFGTAIGVANSSSNYYALSVHSGMTNYGSGGQSLFVVRSNGNIGIGTFSPSYKLDVRGTIRANEILVNSAGADFVFAPDYRLRPLNDVETFIKENKHFPDIAPADSMVRNGVNMGEMQIKLLQKIEELTLYMIEQEKRNNELQVQVYEQQKIIETQNKINEDIKQSILELKNNIKH